MAKVLPASDAQTFLDALETSQILNAESLSKFREQFAGVDDVKAVARDLIKAGKITKWQAQQVLGGFTGLVVGNYKLLDQLGVGEMGRVYLAEHIQMQRKVALKVLARKHTAQPQVLRRLLAEARRVAAIEHPNISHIQDVNQDGERYFIVLELIDGEDLQKRVQRDGKLPSAKAWNLIRQTAEGIAHAHSKGIVHGGLKPSNLIVDQQGNVKILDFGLAQLAGGADGASGDSVDQMALTAKLYRAPETSNGPADRAGDVYSLGATLYFFLTGKAPTDGPASAEKIAAAAPDAPPEIIDLCRKLLTENPAERPANEQALISAIDAAQPNAKSAPKPVAPAAKASAPPKAATPAPKTAAALPTAKALPASAGDELVAKAPPPKAKKPLTAKTLPSPTDSGSIPVADSSTQPALSETPTAAAAPSDTPFGGFAIQTKGRGGKAPAKTAANSGAMPAVTAAAPAAMAEAAVAADATAPTKGKKGKGKTAAANGNLPLILAGGIGGGVLVLGLIIGLVIFFTRGGKEKEIAKGDGNEPAVTTPENNTGEANPPEANPIVPEESNPVVPAEVNPVVPPATVDPMPMPVTPAVDPTATTPTPMPATPEPPKTNPPKTDPPMVASIPEVKPEPKPVPKPMPVGDPFVGFGKSVALPKLPVGISEPTPEMLVAVVLGPCRIPDENTVITGVLKGGETAYSKSKMKFSIESGNGGTSLRDWDFKLSGGLVDKPVTIATMHAKNDQLTFQWVAEAAKQPAAAYLCNCVVELKAGNGKAEFALRQPVGLEPIVIGIEKRTAPFKFNVDLPPEQKQLMFEIIAIESEAPKVKFDNKDLVAEKDTTFFWVGNVETELPLGIKVDTSVAGARTVQATFVPHIKLEGMPRPMLYSKKDLGTLKGVIDGDMYRGNLKLQEASQIRDAKKKSELTQEGTLLLEPAQKRNAQFEQMLALAKSLQNGKLHFRVYALAEEGKVELANSNGVGAAPAPGPAAPEPAAPVLKAPAGPAGNAGANNPPAARPPRPGPKAAVARAPIGTTEATAEQIFTESRQLEAFDTQSKGKSFRLTGTVAAVQDTEVHLTGQADGVVIMKFAKKADVVGIAKGAQVVIDGEYAQLVASGPVFRNCEVTSK